MIITREQAILEKDELRADVEDEALKDVSLPPAPLPSPGMGVTVTKTGGWRRIDWNKTSTRTALMGIIAVAILLLVVVAVLVVLFQTHHNQYTKLPNKYHDDDVQLPSFFDEANLPVIIEEGDNDTPTSQPSTEEYLLPFYEDADAGMLVEQLVPDFSEYPDSWDDFDEGDYTTATRQPTSEESPESVSEDPDAATVEEHDLLVVTKSGWGGLPADAVNELQHPTPYVVISQTGGLPCFSEDQCGQKMRLIQDIHRQEDNLPDIGVNFYIGGDGVVYEGRGWDATNFHVGFVRHRNIGISFIGDFELDVPSSAQLQAAQDLVSLGVALGKLAPDYKLLAHYQIELPDSMYMGPGSNLLSVINSWPHRCLRDCDDTSIFWRSLYSL